MPRSPLKRRARLRAGQSIVSPAAAERPKFGSKEYAALYHRKRGQAPTTAKRHPGNAKPLLLCRLTPSHREAYLAYCSSPGVTLKDCQKWLQARGYRIGMWSIRTLHCHQRRMLQSHADHLHRVLALNRVQQFLGPIKAVDAATTYVEEQLLAEMAQLLRAKSQGEFDAQGWKIVAEVVEKLAKTRQAIDRGRAAKTGTTQSPVADQMRALTCGKGGGSP